MRCRAERLARKRPQAFFHSPVNGLAFTGLLFYNAGRAIIRVNISGQPNFLFSALAVVDRFPIAPKLSNNL